MSQAGREMNEIEGSMSKTGSRSGSERISKGNDSGSEEN
jgi:hypothetical protein